MSVVAASRRPSETLRQLVAGIRSDRISLGDIADELGATGAGLCLLLFSLASLIPGIAPVFGLALGAVAAGMVLGHSQPLLPQWLRRRQLDRARLQDGMRRLSPFITTFEKYLRPRANYPNIRLAGMASLINGVLIVLPIPFGNTAPAIAMLILSLGLVAGDGLAVGAGLAATVIALAVDAGMIALGYTALLSLIEHLF